MRTPKIVMIGRSGADYDHDVDETGGGNGSDSA